MQPYSPTYLSLLVSAIISANSQSPNAVGSEGFVTLRVQVLIDYNILSKIVTYITTLNLNLNPKPKHLL